MRATAHWVSDHIINGMVNDMVRNQMSGCPHDVAVHAMTVTVPQTIYMYTATSCEYPFTSFGVRTSQQKTTPAACSARSPLDRHAAGNCRSSFFFFCGSPLHRHASNRYFRCYLIFFFLRVADACVRKLSLFFSRSPLQRHASESIDFPLIF